MREVGQNMPRLTRQESKSANAPSKSKRLLKSSEEGTSKPDVAIRRNDKRGSAKENIPIQNGGGGSISATSSTNSNGLKGSSSNGLWSSNSTLLNKSLISSAYHCQINGIRGAI